MNIEFVLNHDVTLAWTTDGSSADSANDQVKEFSIDKTAIRIGSHLKYTGPFHVNGLLTTLTQATNAAADFVAKRQQVAAQRALCLEKVDNTFDRQAKTLESTKTTDTANCIFSGGADKKKAAAPPPPPSVLLQVNQHHTLLAPQASALLNSNDKMTNPEGFMENGPPRSAVAGQDYLLGSTPLDGTDAYIGRHTALEKLGPSGELNLNTNKAITPSDDLGKQDTLNWIYGSKEATVAPPPMQPFEDAVGKAAAAERPTPPMLPSTVMETGAFFADGGGVKVDNNLPPLSAVAPSEPANQPSPPMVEPLEDPIKGDEGEMESLGTFDEYGKPEEEA